MFGWGKNKAQVAPIKAKDRFKPLNFGGKVKNKTKGSRLRDTSKEAKDGVNPNGSQRWKAKVTTAVSS